MYYHSVEWGFDKNYQQKKQRSREGLSALKLPMLSSISCSFRELSSGKISLSLNGVYLVTVDDTSKVNPRIGYFGIRSISELIEYITRDYGECSPSLNACQCHIIEQLFPCDGCFTGAVFSNGHGELVCEVISNTIDNRELTSGGNKEYQRKRIIYSESTLCVCDDLVVWSTILRELTVCLKHKGYYEFAYGLVSGIKDVFFSYYSEDEMYQNIFPFPVLLEDEYIRCRCIENCYLQYVGTK